jgi:putative ABC transport system ATP-binding protein
MTALRPVDEPPVVALQGVTKIYGSGETEVRALDGIDLSIARGEFVTVMGPSGSGKSTAMNILGCLDTPTAGRYLFAGHNVSTLSADQRGLLRRYYLGFVFQGFNLLRRTTALENVELPLIYRGMSEAERRTLAREALSRVGLGDREHHTASELSGGQQQRVAIARALVSSPRLLLADEPTGNLDTQRSREIMELFVKLNEEERLTIVVVTHEADIAAFSARTVEFRDGRIARDEPVRKRALS